MRRYFLKLLPFVFIAIGARAEQCQITAPLPMPVSLNIANCTFVGPILPPGSTSYIQNTSVLQPGAIFYVSSGTVTSSLSLPYLTPGQCTTTDATGKFINTTCGSGGGSGSSALETIFGTARSSPTATIRANAPFKGSVTGSTNTLSVDYSSFTMQGIVTAASLGAITGNQNISITGDSSGSGTTAITLTASASQPNITTFPSAITMSSTLSVSSNTILNGATFYANAPSVIQGNIFGTDGSVGIGETNTHGVGTLEAINNIYADGAFIGGRFAGGYFQGAAILPTLAMFDGSSEFGVAENNAPLSWDLGYSASQTTLGTPVLLWNKSPWVDVKSSMTVEGAKGLNVTYGVSAGSLTLTGAGNFSITNPSSVSSPAQVLGSTVTADPTGSCAQYSSSWTFTPITCGTGGGGSTPGGSPGQLQWNSAGSFAGASSIVTASSMTIISSMSITNSGVQNTIGGTGFTDIYRGDAYVGQLLLNVGSQGQNGQFFIADRTPTYMGIYGGQIGGLHVGYAATPQQIVSQSRNNYFEVNLASTMTFNTDNDIGGGDILFKPQSVAALDVSAVNGVTVPSKFGLTSTYNVTAGSMTGAGLTTCGDSTHGLGWSSANNLFTCQNIIGTGGSGGGGSPIAFANGTAAGSTIISSPTTNALYDPATITVTLISPTTAFMEPNPSSVTLQGQNVIDLTSSLQAGATFFISSGTIANALTLQYMQGLSGNRCLQEVNGLVVPTSQDCGIITKTTHNRVAYYSVSLTSTTLTGDANLTYDGSGNLTVGSQVNAQIVSASSVTNAGGTIDMSDGRMSDNTVATSLDWRRRNLVDGSGNFVTMDWSARLISFPDANGVSITNGLTVGSLSLNGQDLQTELFAIGASTTAIGVATGTIVPNLLKSTNTWTGEQVFQSSSVFRGGVYISSTVLLSGSPGNSGQFLTTGGNGAVPTWQSQAATAWGSITGSIGNQTDLQTAIFAIGTSTTNIAASTTSLLALINTVSVATGTLKNSQFPVSLSTNTMGSLAGTSIGSVVPSSVLPSTVAFITSTQTWTAGQTFVSSVTVTSTMTVLNTSIWQSSNTHVSIVGSPPILSSCGTNPSVTGSDTAFTITGGAAAAGCTVTFAQAAINDPTCIVDGEGLTVTYTHSNTGLVITAVGLGTGKLDGICNFHD